MQIMGAAKDTCPKCSGLKDRRAQHCWSCADRPSTGSTHGDVRRYWAGCRCAECRRANSNYAALRKQRRPDLVKAEAERYRARNKEEINARRRRGTRTRALVAARTVKRRWVEAGGVLDELTDVERPTRSRYLVYALVDPRTLAVRYVGVSSSGLERPKQHRLDSVLALGVNKRKDDWIRGLKATGLTYAIRVLEYSDNPEGAHAAEAYWIHWMRTAGEHLYNQTAGDDTHIHPSEETRQKMRDAMRGRKITWGDKISAAKRRRGRDATLTRASSAPGSRRPSCSD